MTACTDVEILDEYEIAHDADSSPAENEKVSSEHATGSVQKPVSSVYPENDAEALDKRSTETIRIVNGDGVDAATNASQSQIGLVL